MGRCGRQARMAALLALLGTLGLLAGGASGGRAQEQTASTGKAVVTLWVNPRAGNDARSGTSRAQALETVNAAWNRIPAHKTLAQGYRLMLTAGTYAEAGVPGYWESRWGTASAPISIESADGPGKATLPPLNIFDVRYLSLVGLRVHATSGDVVHCERCDHFTLSRMQVAGTRAGEEAVKINQSKHVVIEDSDIAGAGGPGVDFVAVQYGEVLRNRIHSAGDWCMYAKGGSAYLRYEGNEIFDCGTGGFSAGQGTGFEFMVTPWLHYEVYDVVFVNNVVHDTQGAGMGVNGGYNVLLAYNTLYRVGARSHAVEVVFGLRGCDGGTARCRANLSRGGWGTVAAGRQEPIPDRNVYVLDNVVLNPTGYRSQWQQFAVYGPRAPAAASNIPSPARTDVNLHIQGNVIWNGPASHPLGIEGNDQGCRPANPTCNATQLRADNAVNTVKPQLADPAHGNFRPASGSALLKARTVPLPAFGWSDAPKRPPVPRGTVSTTVSTDRDGKPRPPGAPPGAYAAP